MKRFGYFANLRRDNDYVGLKTRTMNENPTTGMRTMSRKNLQNYVLPTPWYMVSFLFRFYSGSSYLKLIPPRPASIVESFLMFDEELAPQDPINESYSYGQPIFQQQQQVSNAYEIRTPYYRAVRCDVVNTTQTPVMEMYEPASEYATLVAHPMFQIYLKQPAMTLTFSFLLVHHR
jgi:hypothetical protein